MTVGTDTGGYGIGSYNSARVQTFEFFFNEGIYSSWSPLVKILIWLTAQIGNTPFFVFFFLQLATVVPYLYAAATSCRGELPFSVLIYGMVFFPMSFNLMRQMVAMSFVLAAFVRLWKRDYAGVVALSLAAWGFHSASLVYVMVLPVYFIGKAKFASLGIKSLMMGILVTIGLLLVVPLLTWLTATLDLFTDYITGSAVVAGAGRRTGLEMWFIFLTLTLLGRLFMREGRTNDDLLIVLFLLVLFGLGTYLLSGVSFWLYRIGMSYIYFTVLLIPYSAKLIETKRERSFYKFVAVSMIVVFCFDYYEVCLNNEVVPYVFASSIF